MARFHLLSWGAVSSDAPLGSADFRRLVVYKDPNSEANAFVAYTDVRPDFATLGSFGSIRDVAKTIIPTGKGKRRVSCGVSVSETHRRPPSSITGHGTASILTRPLPSAVQTWRAAWCAWRAPRATTCTST